MVTIMSEKAPGIVVQTTIKCSESNKSTRLVQEQ